MEGSPVQANSSNTPQPVLVIESDALQLWWEAQCMKPSTGGHWSAEEAIDHIKYLEILAAFLTLKIFANNHILLRLDNTSAVTYIKYKGSIHSTQLSNLALGIW